MSPSLACQNNITILAHGISLHFSPAALSPFVIYVWCWRQISTMWALNLCVLATIVWRKLPGCVIVAVCLSLFNITRLSLWLHEVQTELRWQAVLAGCSRALETDIDLKQTSESCHSRCEYWCWQLLLRRVSQRSKSLEQQSMKK